MKSTVQTNAFVNERHRVSVGVEMELQCTAAGICGSTEITDGTHSRAWSNGETLPPGFQTTHQRH